MKLPGFLSGGKVPDFYMPEQSPDTENIIGVQQQRADMSPAQMVEEGIKNIPNEGAAQAKELSSFNRALGMASPDQLSEVLSKRMERSRDSDLANLRRTQAPGAWMQKSNRQLQVGNNRKRAAQINLEVQEGIRTAQSQKKKARNAMIGNMLGIAGSIGGTVLGSLGGPMGAAAGSKMGSTVGAVAGADSSTNDEGSGGMS